MLCCVVSAAPALPETDLFKFIGDYNEVGTETSGTANGHFRVEAEGASDVVTRRNGRRGREGRAERGVGRLLLVGTASMADSDGFILQGGVVALCDGGKETVEVTMEDERRRCGR